MAQRRALKLVLKRGALVAAANWPVVLAQFVADALFKTVLAVPVVGGIALVALVAGADPGDFVRGEASQIVPTLIDALGAQPVALAAFVVAFGLVATGGSVMMFAVKAGTLTVLAAGERSAGAVEHPPLRLSAIARADQFSIERFTGGMRRLFPRYLALGSCLAVAYLLSGAAYATFVFGPWARDAVDGTLLVGLASLGLIGWITWLNFVYLLAQVITAADDCPLRDTLRRVGSLLARETGPVLGVLGAILSLMVLTTAASILATAALGLIAFVPFVGLAALPLQIVAWLVRGIVFQYISLAGAAAYLRLHRLSTGAAVDVVHALGSASRSA
jgi:hypothetical protein